MKKKYSFTLAFLVLLIISSCLKKKEHIALNELLALSNSDSLKRSEKIFLNEKIAKIINTLPNAEKSENYYKLANRYWNIEDFKKYESCVKLGIFEAKQNNQILLRAEGYKRMGEFYALSQLVKKDSVYFYLQLATDIYESEKENYSLAELKLVKASLLFQQNNFIESEYLTWDALDFFGDSLKTDKIFQCYILLGANNVELKNYDIALDHFINAEKYANDNNWRKATVLNNIGKVYLELGKYKTANIFFEKGIKILNNESRKIASLLLQNRAIAYCMIAPNTEKSYSLFQKALQLTDSIGSESVQARVNFARHLSRISNTELAIKLSRDAYNMSTNADDKILSIETLINLCDTESSKYLFEYGSLISQRNDLDNKIKINAMRMSRNFDSANKLSSEKLITKKWIIYSLTFLTFILSAIGLIQYSKNRNREILSLKRENKINDEIHNLMVNLQVDKRQERIKERKRIASELHDSVITTLTSIRLNFHMIALENQFACKEFFDYLDQIQHVEKNIRTLSYDMFYSCEKENVYLPGMIEDLLQQPQFLDLAAETQFDDEIFWSRISIEVSMNLYRIFQEALTNCYKHAEASKIFVSIYMDENYLNMRIEDNGKGFVLKSKKGLGLQNLEFRANQIGADLTIESTIGHGTQIRLKLKY